MRTTDEILELIESASGNIVMIDKFGEMNEKAVDRLKMTAYALEACARWCRRKAHMIDRRLDTPPQKE